MPRLVLPCVTVWLACCSALPILAQQKPRTAEEAIQRFDRDRAEPKKRWRAVKELDRFDDPRITSRLLDELATVRDDLRYRANLTDALGAMPRDGAIEALRGTLFEEPGSRAIRRSSAKGIARQGAAGVRVLLELLDGPASRAAIDKAKNGANHLRDIRESCIAGLGVSRSEVAHARLGALIESKLDFEVEQALRALASVEGSKAADAARIAACANADLEIAATAARQLARHGHPAAVEHVLRVQRKLKVATREWYDARPIVVEAFVPLLSDERVFEPFLVAASYPDGDVDSAVDKAMDTITESEPLMAWLLAEGLKRKSELERCLAIRILAHSKAPTVTETLIGLMASREPAIVYSAVRALGVRGDRAAVPALRKLLGARDGERRIEALFGLHALLRDDPEWSAELLELLDTKDRALRATVLDFLADVESKAGIAHALADVDDKSWSVRAAAYDFLRRVRSREAIPALIERLDDEDGRLREDVLDTLQSLTARRFPEVARWRSWWKSVEGSFEVVPARDAEPSKAPDRGKTVSYYDIPLSSKRAIFVVDVSGSMRHQVGTDASRTRLDEAKRQLRNVVENMPDDTQFNIVYFHHKESQTFKRLTKASKEARRKALKQVDATKSRGGTNVHDALKKAFADDAVDTIYLLSDGYPSAGPIQNVDALADEVARWNRTRQIRIHCIAIGSDSRMLRRIADESGGTFAHYR